MNDLPDTVELTAFVNRLADSARTVTMRYFRRHVSIEHKADNSPVTIADRETEQALRALIGERFPDHDIYGEEFGRGRLEQRYCWVIDPIDGTKSFVSGFPTFGTLIALLEDGAPIFGAVEMPALKERWIGGRGLATLHDGQPCHSGVCEHLSEAGLFSTSIDMFKGEVLQRYQALSQQVRMRRFGSDCYAYGLLASGFVDLVVEADMAPYDFCALAPVVSNAGGFISDWQGRALALDSDGTVVAAATEALHHQALAVLARI